MGLDMYLSKKTYVKNWNHMHDSEKHKVVVFKGAQPRTDIKAERIAEVVEEIAYWRKFNALHNWFVNNCQGGVDDCREVYVSEEKLEKLLKLLLEVKAVLDKSKKTVTEDGEVFEDTDELDDLFPTSSGFFFGSTDYDEYYYSEVSETIDVLQELLAEPGDKDLYYSSSW